MNHGEAPELHTGHWRNVDAPVTLSDLEGRVVVIGAFQMLRHERAQGCQQQPDQRNATHFL